MTSKLEMPIDETTGTRPFRHPATFTREPTTGPERLAVGNAGDGAELLRRLAFDLEPPYLLLYVLHTPRGPSEEGRHESDPHSREELASFLERYGRYLAGDARGRVDVPSPHVHHYREEFDADADELLASRPWFRSDLLPPDRQYPA